MEPILVDKGEASRLLSLSVRTIEGLIARGALPARHVGRRTLILREALVKFARCRGPVPPRMNRGERESTAAGVP
jgi:excisionase family DNA binding protein